MIEPCLKNIHKLPRFVASISPQEYQKKTLSGRDAIKPIQEAQVRARGWYFPHINGPSMGPNSDYLQDSIDIEGWSNHVERWRFYASGLFVFEGMLWEYPNAELQRQMRIQADRYMSSGARSNAEGFVSFVGAIYAISEVYVFAKNLVQSIQVGSGVEIMVGYSSVRNYALESSDPGVSIYGPYTSHNETIRSTKTIRVDTLVADPLGLSTDAVTDVFQQFAWLDPPRSMIENWQRQIFRRGA